MTKRSKSVKAKVKPVEQVAAVETVEVEAVEENWRHITTLNDAIFVAPDTIESRSYAFPIVSGRIRVSGSGANDGVYHVETSNTRVITVLNGGIKALNCNGQPVTIEGAV